MNKKHEKFTISQWGALMRGGKCLIVRPSDKEWWELPGGRIEINELDDSTAETAFRREIKEELGIDTFIVDCLLGSMIGYSIKTHTATSRLIYLIKNDDSEIKLSSEHSEYRWISLEEVDNYHYSELINATKLATILKKAFSKKHLEL